MARFGQGLIASLANPSWADAAGVAGAQLGMLGGKMREERKKAEDLAAFKNMTPLQQAQYRLSKATTVEEAAEATQQVQQLERQAQTKANTGFIVDAQGKIRKIYADTTGNTLSSEDQARVDELQAVINAVANDDPQLDATQFADIAKTAEAGWIARQTARLQNESARATRKAQQDNEEVRNLENAFQVKLNAVTDPSKVNELVTSANERISIFARQAANIHLQYLEDQQSRNAEAAQLTPDSILGTKVTVDGEETRTGGQAGEFKKRVEAAVAANEITQSSADELNSLVSSLDSIQVDAKGNFINLAERQRAIRIIDDANTTLSRLRINTTQRQLEQERDERSTFLREMNVAREMPVSTEQAQEYVEARDFSWGSPIDTFNAPTFWAMSVEEGTAAIRQDAMNALKRRYNRNSAGDTVPPLSDEAKEDYSKMNDGKELTWEVWAENPEFWPDEQEDSDKDTSDEDATN
jgi:hypothetical protein